MNWKRKCVLVLLCVLLLLSAAGCGKEKALAMDETACLAPLKWGMTEAEVMAALEKLGAQPGPLARRDTSNTYRLETTLFEMPVTIDLVFGKDWAGLAVEKPELAQTPLLSEIWLWFQRTERSAVREKVTAVLGERETRRIVYKSDIEGERVEPGPQRTEEEGDRWHSSRSFFDQFGEARLQELFGLQEQELAEASMLRRVYDIFLYDAKLNEVPPDQLEGGGCLLQISGWAQVYANVLGAA